MPATIVGPVPFSPGLPSGVSAAINLTGPQIVKAAPGVCVSILVVTPGTAGAITLNDTTSVGGAAATNEIFSAPFSALTAGQSVKLNWPCSTGIVVSAAPTGGQFSLAFA
jgi:hypothetical protein